MKIFLFPLALYLAIKVFLFGVGAVLGLLLHWLAPSIDLGTAILIGVVTTGFTIHFLSKFLMALKMQTEMYDEPDREGSPFGGEPGPPAWPRKRKWRR
ncbi:hypothetical protein BH23PLA1_BH23PLA1_21560 [soil metagenome]